MPPTMFAPGIATFKWSRDNGSVITGVTSIANVTNSAGNPASQLTVQSLGRDQVLGFAPGNWIEILDDAMEFGKTPASCTRSTPSTSPRRRSRWQQTEPVSRPAIPIRPCTRASGAGTIRAKFMSRMAPPSGGTSTRKAPPTFLSRPRAPR